MPLVLIDLDLKMQIFPIFCYSFFPSDFQSLKNFKLAIDNESFRESVFSETHGLISSFMVSMDKVLLVKNIPHQNLRCVNYILIG